MIIADRYVYDPETDRLGKGGFGSVFKALDQQTQQTVALKFVPQSKLPTRYSLSEENQRLKSLSHPNLVKYYDVVLKDFENIAGEKDLMQIGVMEYVNGGDLGAYMKMPFARQAIKIKSLLTGILEGLAYLHNHKIIHRDIKPQNILLAIEGQQITPKIADFSLSKQLSNELTSVSAAVGTYEYMSPEQLGRGDSKVGITTDIWAFGVLMYQLLTQSLPFGSRRKGETDGEIVANIIDPQFVPDFSEITPEYQAIIKKCLEKDPNQRFQNAHEILALLNPPTENTQNTARSLTLPEISSFFSEIKDETEEDPLSKTKSDPSQTIYQSSDAPSDFFANLPTQQPHKASNNFQEEVTHTFEVSPSFANKDKVPEDNTPTNFSTKQGLGDETLLGIEPYSALKKSTDFETIEVRKSRNNAPLFAILVMLFLGFLGWAWAKGYFATQPKQEDKTLTEIDSLATSTNEKDTLASTQKNEVSNPEKKQITHTKTDKTQTSANTTTYKSNTQLNKTETNTSTSTSPVPITEEETSTKPSPNNNTPSIRYDYEEEGSLGKIVSKNGLYGFIDKNGVMLVPLQYQDFAYPQEGLAAVKQGNKWGFINLKNQVVIPFRYDRPGNFRNGRAQVSLGDRDFYIDRKGNPLE